MGPRVRRWFRIVGQVTALGYTVLAAIAAYTVIDLAVDPPIDSVFPPMDGPAILGYFIAVGFLGGSGLLAIVCAFYLKGRFRILYAGGVMALLAAWLYLPVLGAVTPDYDCHPDISGPEVLIGKWKSADRNLELRSDSTYLFTTRVYPLKPAGGHAASPTGTWRLDGNKLYLTNIDPRFDQPWLVCTSGGYYFIRTEVPENADAWTGSLGMMREADWDATH